MLLDGCFIIVVSWGISSAYIVATNFDWIKERLGFETPDKQQADLNRMVNNAKAIQSILNDVQRQTNSGRAFIIYFHNGKTGVDGKSFFFKSMTHESLKPGVASSIEAAQNLPASLNVEQMGKILADECYSYSAAKGSNPAFDDLMKKHGTAKTLDCPLQNMDGHIIGYLGIAYLDEDDQKISDDKAYSILKIATDKLRYLL